MTRGLSRCLGARRPALSVSLRRYTTQYTCVNPSERLCGHRQAFACACRAAVSEQALRPSRSRAAGTRACTTSHARSVVLAERYHDKQALEAG